MKTFELHRDEDETGISGTGVVAEGAMFTDGTCVVRWLTETTSTAIYANEAAVLKIHGHNGKTRIVWTGDAFYRGYWCCLQDGMENNPFGGIGGLAKRESLRAPNYITPRERQAWVEGYECAAKQSYGADWRTCSFSWGPAITLGTKEELEEERAKEGVS